MSDHVLREKIRKKNNEAAGQIQYSVLRSKVKSHSHAYDTKIRHHACSGADFGKRITEVINSRNMISDIWLQVEFSEGDEGQEYAKNRGLCVLDSLQLRCSGKSFHDYDYSSTCFSCAQKWTDEEKKAELLSLCGGAKSNLGGKCIVPIFSYFSTFCRDFQNGEAWMNPESASRLEIQLQFAAKSSYTDAHTSQTMDGVQLFYREIIVPQRMEAQFKPKTRHVEIIWNSVDSVTTVIGTAGTEVDLSSLLSGGNIRQLLVRQQTAAQRTGATKDVLATLQVSAMELKINGQSLFEMDAVELRMQKLLQKYHYGADTSPTSYAFCADPSSNDKSGYLPSSNDKLTLVFTPAAVVTDVIAEIECVFTRNQGGRITKSDN